MNYGLDILNLMVKDDWTPGPCTTRMLAEDCKVLHGKLNELSELYKLRVEERNDLRAELEKLQPKPKFRVGQLVHVYSLVGAYPVAQVNAGGCYYLSGAGGMWSEAKLSAVMPEEIS